MRLFGTFQKSKIALLLLSQVCNGPVRAQVKSAGSPPIAGRCARAELHSPRALPFSSNVELANISTGIPAAYTALPSTGGTVALQTDITISVPQIVRMTPGKPFKLDFAGHAIRCTVARGICLLISKPDANPRYRLEIAGSSGTLTYAGSSPGITGLQIGVDSAHGASDVSLHDVNFYGFSTLESVALQWFGIEEAEMFNNTFTGNFVGWRAGENTNNTFIQGNWFHLNKTAFILTDVLGMDFTENLIQSNTATRPAQFVANAVGLDTLTIEQNWFENNGDGTANSRALSFNIGSKAGMNRMQLVSNTFAPGINTPTASTYVEKSGVGIALVNKIDSNLWNSGPSIQTGFSRGNLTTCINESWNACDIVLNTQSNPSQMSVGVAIPHGSFECGMGGNMPDALRNSVTHGCNISDSENVTINIGLSDDETIRGFLQARDLVGDSHPRLLTLQELGGNLAVGSSTDNGARFQVDGNETLTGTISNYSGIVTAGTGVAPNYGTPVSLSRLAGNLTETTIYTTNASGAGSAGLYRVCAAAWTAAVGNSTMTINAIASDVAGKAIFPFPQVLNTATRSNPGGGCVALHVGANAAIQVSVTGYSTTGSYSIQATVEQLM